MSTEDFHFPFLALNPSQHESSVLINSTAPINPYTEIIIRNARSPSNSHGIGNAAQM
jgi:hypothetical protein